MHANGMHRQRVAKIDHVVQAVSKKVIGHGAAFKNSQETDSIEYLFESSGHPDSPQITSVHAGCRSFAGATNSGRGYGFRCMSAINCIKAAACA